MLPTHKKNTNQGEYIFRTDLYTQNRKYLSFSLISGLGLAGVFMFAASGQPAAAGITAIAIFASSLINGYMIGYASGRAFGEVLSPDRLPPETQPPAERSVAEVSVPKP